LGFQYVDNVSSVPGEGYTSIEFVRRPHWINFNVFTLWLNHMKNENGPMQCIIQNGELDCRHIKKHSWVYIPSQPHRLWNVERARLESCRSWVRFPVGSTLRLFNWYRCFSAKYTALRSKSKVWLNRKISSGALYT
jgi:hypothetical protein